MEGAKQTNNIHDVHHSGDNIYENTKDETTEYYAEIPECTGLNQNIQYNNDVSVAVRSIPDMDVAIRTGRANPNSASLLIPGSNSARRGLDNTSSRIPEYLELIPDGQCNHDLSVPVRSTPDVNVETPPGRPGSDSASVAKLGLDNISIGKAKIVRVFIIVCALLALAEAVSLVTRLIVKLNNKQVNGEWGSICDNKLDKHGWPSLFCRNLGYTRAADVPLVRPSQGGSGLTHTNTCTHTDRDIIITCTDEDVGVSSEMVDVARQLTKGVQREAVRKGSVPGTVIVLGWRAIPVLVGAGGDVVMAAARYGRGRVIVFPHNYLQSDLPRHWNDTTPGLYSNIRRWLTHGKPSMKLLHKPSAAQLKQDIVATFESVSDSIADAVLEFVADGGSVVISCTTWYFAAHYKSTLLSLQKFLWKVGLSFKAKNFHGEMLPLNETGEYIKHHLGAMSDIVYKYPERRFHYASHANLAYYHWKTKWKTLYCSTQNPSSKCGS